MKINTIIIVYDKWFPLGDLIYLLVSMQAGTSENICVKYIICYTRYCTQQK